MNKLLQILLLFLQTVITFAVLFVIFMLYAAAYNDFGADGMMGLVIFQTFYAIIFSVSTIIICVAAGLPVRLIKKVNDWFSKHWYINLIGIFTGTVFIFLSFFICTKIIMNENNVSMQVPNTFFSVAGWFLTAFSILHIFPPFLKRKNSNK